MTAKIALVDDDVNILTTLAIALEAEGFRVQSYSDSREALDALISDPPNLAVLDIKMPDLDGMELLNRLRRVSKLPAIFLTSKDDEIDEMLGLKMGADDYIRKPFSQRLLIERIRAVLRRADSGATVADEKSDGGFKRGSLVMDPGRHLCSWKSEGIQLTVTEFMILEVLARHPGHVKSRNQLMDAAYEDNIYVDDRTIDSHIKRLRRKFKALDAEFDCIETLYGLGYRYKVDE